MLSSNKSGFRGHGVVDNTVDSMAIQFDDCAIQNKTFQLVRPSLLNETSPLIDSSARNAIIRLVYPASRFEAIQLVDSSIP